jgi:ABC-type phosphate transport system substrate-binding protein
MRAIVTLIGWGLLVPLCAPSVNAAERPHSLTVAAGSSVTDYFKGMIETFRRSNTIDVRLMNDGGVGADKALIAIEKGDAQVAVLASDWETLARMAVEKNLGIKNLSQYVHREVATDKILFIVNKAGPKELSDEQLEKIFSGIAKNWEDLGGGGQGPITIALPTNAPAIMRLVENRVLKGKPIQQSGAKFYADAKELIKFITDTRGAISFCSALVDRAGVRAVASSVVSRPILAVTPHKPDGDTLKLIEFIERHPPKEHNE